jgi:hypothetical protein
MTHVESLQTLSEVLDECQRSHNNAVAQSEASITAACDEIQAKMATAVHGFARYQSLVRIHATSHQDEELTAKLSNRDAARANLCSEIRESLAQIAIAVFGEHKPADADTRHEMTTVADDANARAQQLNSALAAARECVIKYNMSLKQVSARMGAEFDSSSFPHADSAQALSLWREWKEMFQGEQAAAETDARMRAARDALTNSVGDLLGIDNKQHEEEATSKVKEAVIAAGKALDYEASVQASNPMLLVPVSPLITAGERLLLRTHTYTDALQRACTVYDGFQSMHDAQSQCLDVQGQANARKQQAIEAMQLASKTHRRAIGELKQEEIFEQYPELAEVRGMSAEQVRESVKEKKKLVKETAAALQAALALLLEVQDHFPEVCAHVKAGLPQELLAVWRPDLTLDMFEMRETLSTGSKHTVYKATMDGKVYALKEFTLGSDRGLQELMSEAAMLRRMRHPYIVEIISLFEDTASKGSKKMLIQMPFFEHGTLSDWVLLEVPNFRAVRTVLLDVAGALEYLHAASVIHADIKPAK